MTHTGPTSSDRKRDKAFPLQEATTDLPLGLKQQFVCMVSQADADRLQSLHNQLVHEINRPDKLASHLYSQRAITQMEMEDVQAEKTRYKQVQELLNIVSRKSQHTFTAFTKALCLYNQKGLAELVANKRIDYGKNNNCSIQKSIAHLLNITIQ